MIVECQSCGAPLSVPGPSARYVECGYCHKTNRLRTMRTIQAQTPPDWRPPPTWESGGRTHQYGRTSVKLVTGGVLLAIGGTVFASIAGILGMLVAIGVVSFGAAESIRHASSPSWDGQRPLTCAGHEQMTVSGLTARLPADVAVTVADHCHLTLDGCSIEARLPIHVSGHGVVVMRGGSLTGSPTAIEARDHATVTASGAAIVGEVLQDRHANVVR